MHMNSNTNQAILIGSTNYAQPPAIDNMKIRIVCAFKGAEQNFPTMTMLGRSLILSNQIQDCELLLVADNKHGLSTVYNQAIEDSQSKPVIMVFVHDDVLITDYHWQRRIREGLKQFDIVGVAGNTQRVPGQPGWIIQDTNMKLADKNVLSGAIGQGTEFPPPRLDVFGPTGLKCKLLDGVFLAARSDRLHETGLRFDSQFEFNFYDLDFCRSAEKLGLNMGTIDLSLVHASLGTLDQRWVDDYNKYIQKWGN